MTLKRIFDLLGCGALQRIYHKRQHPEPADSQPPPPDMATLTTHQAASSSLTNSPEFQKPDIPDTQSLLLLHGKGETYQYHADGDVPQLRFGELLVDIHAIGLNPIDWKSAAYGFGLPRLPSQNGREFVGKVIASEVEETCDLKPGEWVLSVSTDYRDFRKAAFQEFAVVCCYNAIRIPHHVDPGKVASVGVAFIAAGLALGVCFGITFTKGPQKRPFNLLGVAQKYRDNVPEDVLPEIEPGIAEEARPREGEWVLIYGASTTTAQILVQLAKRAGLKVAGVANVQKHRKLLESLGYDLLLDRNNLDEAVKVIPQQITSPLRFAIDTIGGDTASWCQDLLAEQQSSLSSSGASTSSHLVTLTGKPKTAHPSVQVHQVPIKLFHEHEKIGGHLSKWLYELLDKDLLRLPEVEFVDGGLSVVNEALERLRGGTVSGKRLVVRTKEIPVRNGVLRGVQ